MYLTPKQKAIIYGLILGDGYLQKTGQRNARLRIEHSVKQKIYVDWLRERLTTVFQKKPDYLKRLHPYSKRTYEYYRFQSNASPLFGQLRKKFYTNTHKSIPEDIDRFLESPVTLAVWYMDDGYYSSRDRMAFIYLPKYNPNSLERLKQAVLKRFGIQPVIHCALKKKYCYFSFNVSDTEKLGVIIQPYIIPSMVYKLPLTP